MACLIEKFKGKYRLLALYDQTNLFPRDLDGTYSDYDIYISCLNNVQVHYFGKGILEAYIPSLGRGRNIVKAIYSEYVQDIEKSPYLTVSEKEDEKTREIKTINSFDYDGLYKDKELNKIIFNIQDTDEEVLFRFKWDKMEQFEKYFKPKTSAANRSPFSSKNLPKSDYVIPEEDQLKYKEVVSKLPKEDILKVGHLTNDYIKTLVNKKKSIEAIKDDMKLNCMKAKEYVHFIGKWNDYLEYLKKEIEKLC
jgi:hypothetical protein